MRNETERLFKAFCDKQRIEIIELLNGNELCACTLLEQCELSQSGLSYHMRVLIDAGIVEATYEGKWVYYRLNQEGKEKALLTIHQLMDEKCPCQEKCIANKKRTS